MLVEEARWISNTLNKYFKDENFPLLNIGSSTGFFRKEVQPHIYNNIFLPLELKNKKVIHLDMKQDEGVDVVGDLSEDAFRNSIREMGVKSVLCSNLLEHLADPKPICSSIMQVLDRNGLLIITVPYLFPFHKDPIDTFLRPNIIELHSMFPGTEIVESEIIISDGSYWKDMMKNKKYFFIMLCRLFMPFFRSNEWKFIVKDFMNSKKNYQATCLLLRKK